MKKRIAIILSTTMLCMACSGCGTATTTDTYIDPVEQTNGELLIYTGWQNMDAMYNGALTAFKTEYPNVKVTVANAEYYGLEEDQNKELQQKVQTEILAGKGPDIFCLTATFKTIFDDVQKVMMSGALYDINHSINADKSFKRSDYYEPVLDVGVIDGKQYLFPIIFQIPILVTTQEVLDTTGLKFEDCTTYSSLLNIMYQYMQDNPNETRRLLDSIFLVGRMLPQFQALDYKTQKVNIDTPEIKKAFEQAKVICERDRKLYGDPAWGGKIAAEAFKNDEQLFGILTTGVDLVSTAALLNDSKTLVFQPLKNEAGEFQAALDMAMAINNKSPNKKNAYEFIKILIDPDRDRIWEEISASDLERIDKTNESMGWPKWKQEKHRYPYSLMGQSIVKKKSITDAKEYQRVYDMGWYEDPETIPINSDGTQNYENIAVKPLPASFYKDYLAMLDEITACEMNAGLYEKAHGYLSPYLYEDKKSLEACLKQAQDQLEIYISE